MKRGATRNVRTRGERRPRARRPASVSHAIEVQYGTARRGVPHPATLRRWAESLLSLGTIAAAPGVPPASLAVAVRIVGTAESRRLNRQWRGKDRPTNVLSFPAGDAPGPDGEPEVLGDIVVCAPVVLREAREQRKAPQAHWAHMIVHGMLHLFGFDHETARDARIMEHVERRALALHGFPDPYAR